MKQNQKNEKQCRNSHPRKETYWTTKECLHQQFKAIWQGMRIVDYYANGNGNLQKIHTFNCLICRQPLGCLVSRVNITKLHLQWKHSFTFQLAFFKKHKKYKSNLMNKVLIMIRSEWQKRTLMCAFPLPSWECSTFIT